MLDNETADAAEINELDELTRQMARENRRLASRPDIDNLDDAVVFKDGKPVFLQAKNNRVIIERVSSCLSGSPWLDTRSYIVVDVDHQTGYLKLLDEEMRHHASSNFITGIQMGYRFKVPARGIKALPRKRRETVKATTEQPKVETKPKAEKGDEKERRVYNTKGIIHTRIKGLAFRPSGETKATDGMRLLMSAVGTNLKVRSLDGWEETWSPDPSI